MTYLCCRRRPRSPSFAPLASLLAAALLMGLAGCATGPVVVPVGQRTPVDRRLVEYPSGVELVPVVNNLTGPVDIEIDPDGNWIIAESGRGDHDPRIFGVRPNGTTFDIYPIARQFPLNLFKPSFRIYGPVGGITLHDGKVYATHRDENGLGVVTAFEYDGRHTTIVGNLPTRGDHGMSDIAVSQTGRLVFGVGAATNSGVVGLDNWQVGWVKNYPNFSDTPYTDVRLNGFLFRTKNPLAGLFGGGDIANTNPFLPFNHFGKTRIGIPGQRADRPTAAIYSASPGGGGLKVEAHGVRSPVGIAYNEFGTAYFTNQGMELRGTRPVRDDPDALLRLVTAAVTYYGWPDYTADLQPITNDKFQPPVEMIADTGYDAISFLIDHALSNIPPGSNSPVGLEPPRRDTLLQAVFRPLAGAARLDFVPQDGPFSEFHGNAIVPLSGDRAPFATSGKKLIGPIGYKVVRVDLARRGEVSDFVRNTSGGPPTEANRRAGAVMLERPVAVKFDPRDGSMYIVDFGRLEMKGGEERVTPRTGRVFKLARVPERPTTRPSTQPAPADAEDSLTAAAADR